MTKFSFEININASTEKVFGYLSKLENHPHFSTGIRKVEHLGENRYRFHTGPENLEEFQAEISKIVENQQVSMKSSDKESPMDEMGFDLSNAEGATTRVVQWFEIDLPKESDEAKDLSLRVREDLQNLKYLLED